MCIFNAVNYSCGHGSSSSLMEHGKPACVKCEPVFIAMHYYHDQKLYLSFEGQYAQPGRVLESPKVCPCIHPNWWSTSEEAKTYSQQCNNNLHARMNAHFINEAECARVRALVSQQGIDSTRRVDPRATLLPYPRQMLQFIKDLERWQMAPPQKATNVEYQNVSYGCGYYASHECLEGWSGQDILMFRHGKWNAEGRDEVNHVGPVRGRLAIDYGNVRIQPVTQGMDTAYPIISVPKHASLEWVLRSVGAPEMRVSRVVTAGRRLEDATGFVAGNGAFMIV